MVYFVDQTIMKSTLFTPPTEPLIRVAHSPEQSPAGGADTQKYLGLTASELTDLAIGHQLAARGAHSEGVYLNETLQARMLAQRAARLARLEHQYQSPAMPNSCPVEPSNPSDNWD